MMTKVWLGSPFLSIMAYADCHLRSWPCRFRTTSKTPRRPAALCTWSMIALLTFYCFRFEMNATLYRVCFHHPASRVLCLLTCSRALCKQGSRNGSISFPR
jgi:hypothetical protein